MTEDTKTYNSVTYRQKVVVFRYQPGSGSLDFQHKIPNDNVTQMEIVNDVENYVPSCSITVRDNNYTFMPFVKQDGFSFISVFIENEQQGFSLDNVFLIENIELVEKNEDVGTYRISGVHTEMLKLQKNISFSSLGYELPLNLLRSVIKEADLAFRNFQYSTESPEIQYISTSQNNVINDIEYLLDIITNENNGLFVFFYDMISKRFRLVNTNELFRKGEIKTSNTVDIPTKVGMSDRHKTMSEISHVSYLDYSEILELLRPVRYYRFDHVTRKWIDVMYHFRDIVKIFPSPDSDKITSIFEDIEKNRNNNYYYNLQKNDEDNYDLYSRVKKLFLESNVLEFEGYGNLARDVGNLCMVNLNETSNNILYEIPGVWFTEKIRHTFEGEIFKTKTYCCRTHKQKVSGMYSKVN